MRRYGLASAVALGVIIGAIVVSCSGDSRASDPSTAPTIDQSSSVGGSNLNGGGWTPTVAAAASSNDKVLVCHSGNGKHFTEISVSVQGARAHLGDPSTGKGGHVNDYRVSELTPCPPPATPGHVEVCKVAAAGVAVGTNFTFTLTADGESKTVVVAAGAPPAGTCAPAGDFSVGTLVDVHETPQTDVKTTSIVVTPAGAQQGMPNLPGGSATIIVGVGTTSLAFTNQGPTGTLVICKVAGTGVTAGTNFTFTAGGQTQTVAAGAGPNGTCGSSLTLGAGAVTVAEGAVTGTVVQSITGTPTPTNVNLAAGSASTLITAGQESRITFTNAAATTGTLVICKIGGTGVAAGTNFTFTAGNQTQTVAAGAAPNGTCGAALTFPVGTVTVTETAVTGTVVQAITGTPAAPTNINLAGRSATAAIVAGQETRIIFTNITG
jgi:hypothetical protein